MYKFNIENIKLIILDVLAFEVSFLNGVRYHYYKKCTKSKFNIVRAYYLELYEVDAFIYLNINRIVSGKLTKYKRSYKKDEGNWKIFISDLSMRTFTSIDSLNEDDIIEGLCKSIRNQKIISILK